MIEQILAFVLGAGAVACVWVILAVFKTTRKLKKLEENQLSIFDIIEKLQIAIRRENLEIHQRIDQEINRTNELHVDSIKHIDSRVDKLDSKIEAKFNDIFSFDEKKSFEINELRQRINKVIELVDDITGLNIKK